MLSIESKSDALFILQGGLNVQQVLLLKVVSFSLYSEEDGLVS